MGNRVARGLVATVAVLLIAVSYGWRLESAPVYLTADELIIGLNGHALATTGHDLRGTWLPLFFRIDEFRLKGTIWYQPVIMYATAAVLTVAPLTEWAIRLPAVIVGTVDVVLIYLIARLLFQRTAVAVAAAVLMFLTPAHFVHSRFAMDYVFPLPFLLGWLLAQVHYQRSREPVCLFIGSLCLGLGLYSYIAAVVMMVIYLTITAWLLWRAEAPRRHYAIALAGFVLPVLLFVGWVLGHPTIVSETFARYDLGNPNRLSWVGRTEMYWDYFSPSYLFFNGGSEQVFSTRTTGVFLLPMAILIPWGAYRALRSSSPINHALLAGLASAPLAAILLDAGSAINRALEVVPFGVLLAAGAVDRLWPPPAERGNRWRAGMRLAVILLMLVIGGRQWRNFVQDYFGDYRVRSAPLFQGNIESAIQTILDRQPADQQRVYISNGLEQWWSFYVRKHERPDLLGRLTTLGVDRRAIAPGSYVLLNLDTPDSPAIVASLTADGFSTLKVIEDLDGAESFAVLQRRVEK